MSTGPDLTAHDPGRDFTRPSAGRDFTRAGYVRDFPVTASRSPQAVSSRGLKRGAKRDTKRDRDSGEVASAGEYSRRQVVTQELELHEMEEIGLMRTGSFARADREVRLTVGAVRERLPWRETEPFGCGL